MINLVREYFPETSFGADVILGYPGETEEQFMETYNFIKESPLTHLHVFPYAKRKNTTAAKADNHIQNDVKKRRVKEIISLGEEKVLGFSRKLIGKTSEVLFEREKDGKFEGYTSHYIKVKVKSDKNLSNTIQKVKLISMEGNKLVGEIL
jgi:threonylcarbamoyladenosine tRNA methylthiotransferase MtaB